MVVQIDKQVERQADGRTEGRNAVAYADRHETDKARGLVAIGMLPMTDEWAG